MICMSIKTISIKLRFIILFLLEACRACVGRAQQKSTVHELCTAHSARRIKKKGGHTNHDVRIIHIYIEIADVPSMWGSLRSPNHSVW